MKIRYVQAYINGNMNLDMVENVVTHNFMRDEVTQKLGLDCEQEQTSFKAVNSRKQEIGGTMKDVSMKLTDWVARTSFTYVPPMIMK
jgi:hypothetical protein